MTVALHLPNCHRKWYDPTFRRRLRCLRRNLAWLQILELLQLHRMPPCATWSANKYSPRSNRLAGIEARRQKSWEYLLQLSTAAYAITIWKSGVSSIRRAGLPGWGARL